MKYAVTYGFGCDKNWSKYFNDFNEALNFARNQSGYCFSMLVDTEPVGETYIIWTTQGPDGTHFDGRYFAELAAAGEEVVVEFSEGDRVVF